MKKLLSVVLAGAMAMSLAACGGSSTATTTAAPAAAETTAAAAAAAAPAAPAASGDVLELNLAHTLDAEHPVHLGSVYFADKLAELSGGTMHVTVYPNSGLGDEDEVAEIQSYSDSITFSLPSGCVLQNYTGAAYAFDFYFQFDNYDQVWKFYDGEYGDYVKKDLEGTGLKVLNYWDNGFRNLTTSNKEVRTPADLQGMKIRVMNAETHLAAWNALGAAATPIAYAEVYSALQQGVVDGEENPYFNIYGSRFQEVQKYVYNDRHVHDVSPFIVSQKAWDSFTDEQKGWIEEASWEGAKYMRDKAVELEDEVLKKLQDAGMTYVELTPEEIEQFKAAVADVPAQFKDRMGDEAFAEYEKCIAAVH